jgi:hypothetical protein
MISKNYWLEKWKQMMCMNLVRDFFIGAKVELKKEMITDKVECPTCNGAGELNE